MALLIDSATPAGSDSPTAGDDQIRAFKLAVRDIFGIPNNTTLTLAAMDIAAAGLSQIIFADPAVTPASGELGRSGSTLYYRITDARTATTTRALGIIADTTGTPAASIGVGILFQAESADEAPSDFGALDFVASDIGAGTEDTYLSVLLRVAGGALDEKYRFSSTAGSGFAALFTHAVTADRTYTLPDVTGTISVPTFVRKTADEIVNNSTTLQNDDALLAALVANEVVAFQCAIHLTSGVTPDIKVAFTVPSGATLRWGMTGNADPSTNQTSVGATGTGILGHAAGVTLPGHLLLSGTVVNGANAGNLQLQWAQNTADASDTTVLANSWLRVDRIS